MKEHEMMPFQTKYSGLTPANSFDFSVKINSLEAAKAALPIFGGTSAEPAGSTPAENKPSGDPDDSATSSGGGDGTKEITPEQFAQLTTQVAQLTQKNTELTQTLQGYQTKEEDERKKSLGREEALTEDLTKAQETIDRMDQVIKRLAVVNAIQGNENLQFHNVDDVISKLDAGGYDLEVDLEAGRATASGIENELSRIAKDYPYLVKKPTIDDNPPPSRQRRSTGNPPGPAPTNPTAAQRRKELEAKWPVIASGRAALG
jgi:hypothetical protein